MNLGAGQPASLPYGIESQRWYSYHPMQFSSSMQQSPIFSVCYHQPPSENYPSPNHYPPPHHFIQQNPYPPPLHFTQLNSYPYPPPTMPNPYSAYAYQPHIIPTNQFVPTTHEPTPNPQPCSVPLQLDQVTDPGVPVVDLSPSSSKFSDARIDEFIESMSRLFDNCIAKCMKGIRISEGSSPSVPTQTTKLKSSEPRDCSPLRLQPVPNSSSLLGNAQSLSVSRPHIKQPCGKAISATRGVKKHRRFSSGIVAPRATGKYRKCKPQFQRLVAEIAQDVKANRTFQGSTDKPASSYSVSIYSSIPKLGFVSTYCNGVKFVLLGKIDGSDENSDGDRKIFDKNVTVNGGDDEHLYDAIDFVFGDKLIDIDVTCDNEKRKSSDMKVRMQNSDENKFNKLEGDSVKGDEHGSNLHVKGREFCALHLLDNMSRSYGFCNAGRRVAALTSIRDKGGGLAHQPLGYAIGRNYEVEGEGFDKSVGNHDHADDGNHIFKIIPCLKVHSDGIVVSGLSLVNEIIISGEAGAIFNENGSIQLKATDVADMSIRDKGGGLALNYVWDDNTLNFSTEVTLLYSPALVNHEVSISRDELLALDEDFAGSRRLLGVRPFNKSSAIGNSEILAAGNSSKLTFALVFENELEKMSLFVVEKFKKMEGDASMVFDDIWGRWKCIVIDADEYCIDLLHIKFLEHCMKPNEKCTGYMLSTFDAPHTMLKLGFKFKYRYVLQPLSSYYNVSVMGGTFPSLELLQQELQTGQLDVKALASAIIQLCLANS